MMVALRFFSLSEIATDRIRAAFSAPRMTGFGRSETFRRDNKGFRRAARTDAGISQEVLAERADIDRTYPSLMERGLRQPTLGMVVTIADALRIEPGKLVTTTVTRLRGDAS